MNADELKLISDMNLLVEQLSGLLDQEYVLIRSTHPDDVYPLLDRKEQMLAAIARLEPALSDVLELKREEPAVASLMGKVRRCHELNQRNRTATQVQISHTAKSLDLLRSLLKMNDVPVYGASGRMTVSREKRDLGSA